MQSRVEPPKRRQSVTFDFAPAPHSGEDVARLRGVDKRYGSRVIYQGLDLPVRRGELGAVVAGTASHIPGSKLPASSR